MPGCFFIFFLALLAQSLVFPRLVFYHLNHAPILIFKI